MLVLLLVCMQDWSLISEPSWSLDSTAKEVITSTFVEFAEADGGRREAPLKPLVELWTTSPCPPCDRMKSDIAGGCLYGASIVWNRGNRPDTSKGFPQCRVNGESFVGWSDAVKADVRRAAGLAPTIKQSLIVAAPTHSEMKALHDRLHGGGSWSWPGDLRNHLETVHGVDLGQAIRAKPVQVQSRGESCPNGYCPQPQRRGLFGRRR